MKLRSSIIYIIVVNFLFISMYIYINRYTSNKIVTLNEKISSIQQKEILIFDITQHILNLESMFYKLSVFSINNSDMILHYYQDKIDKEIAKINKLLQILKNGGTYHIITEANFSDNIKIKKNIKISKSTSSVEIDDILTKLKIIKKWNSQIYKTITSTNQNVTFSNVIHLKRELKLYPSIFNRMIENINRYLQKTEKDLTNTISQRDKFLKNSLYVQIALFILYFVINSIIIYLIFKDIKEIYKELEYRLYHDNLTKLKNRLALERDITNYQTLIVLDIDNFSDINEIYGFEIGNVFLKEFGKLLKNLTSYEIYRIGSDEFAIALEDEDSIYAYKIYEKIRKSTIYLEKLHITITNIDVTIGVATKTNLLSNVIFALKLAKQNHKNVYIVKKDDIIKEKEKIEYTMYWAKRIREAIEKDLIYPFFQPIADAEKNCVKYEVLMRMKEGDKYIPPFFLDIALKTNLYAEISKMIFTKAMQNKLPISFNLSYTDIEDEKMRIFIFDKVKEYEGEITFEILENETIKDYKLLKEFVLKLKKLGAEIAIDDFGSGYSNFKRILEIQPDYIKIDGSLIKNINHDSKSLNIVKSMILFAKNENIKTVAEYVEDEEIFDICNQIGIDLFQGYYISKPIPLYQIKS